MKRQVARVRSHRATLQLRMPAAICAAAICAASSCSRDLPSQRLVWTTGAPGSAVHGAYGAGDVVPTEGGAWIVYSEETSPGEPRIRVRRAGPARDGAAAAPLVASFEGASPSLLVLATGQLVLVHEQTGAAGGGALLLRAGSKDGRTWSAPRRLTARPGRYRVANGRLVRTARGTWLLPAVHDLASTDSAAREVVCLRSEDAGATWVETSVLRGPDAADPALAAIDGGRLLLVLRSGRQLARCESSDEGRSWSSPLSIGIEAGALAPALGALPGGVALAWTDPPPDSSQAPPGVQALRLAVTRDAGRTWRPLAPLAWCSGCVPGAPALAFEGRTMTAFFARRSGPAGTLACIAYDMQRLEPSAREIDPPRGRYGVDPERAADALELLCSHTLARPETSHRLFVEGYFMRSLVVADEVLGGGPSAAEALGARPPARGATGRRPPPFASRPSALDTRQGVARAISFADWMLRGQDAEGYWPLGYKAVYVADMAAVVGLFAALAPHVDTERVRGYESSAARFAAALERDGMLLPSGACGVGWPETRARSDSTAVRAPYLVSTALAGIEVHAWLDARTHDPRYRARALAALDYTLGELQPDGSFAAIQVGEAREGPFAIAAYVQEGWIAADLFLQDAAVRARLRRALPPHVAWLLRTQRPDGLWGGTGADGEFARTPAILDFLIWYDQRCESRQDVRQAVRRASVALCDPDAWRALGLLRPGKNEEVMRAIAGRPLAALAAERFVF